MQMASRFKYSDQVFGYVPKPMKKRLRAIRRHDPRRYSESSVILRGLERVIDEIEKEINFSKPTQKAPGSNAA